MSRCVLDNKETGCEIVIGWDAGLDTFFAQIIQPGEDFPSYWQGTYPSEFKSPDSLVDAILPVSCKVNRSILIANLLQDKLLNDDRIYSIDDEQVKNENEVLCVQ